MKMNRIQFQPGLSMPEFFERYGSETQCQAALQGSPWDRAAVKFCNGFYAQPFRVGCDEVNQRVKSDGRKGWWHEYDFYGAIERYRAILCGAIRGIAPLQ